MKPEKEEKTNILLHLTADLNERLQERAKIERRSRNSLIVFILEKYFSEQDK